MPEPQNEPLPANRGASASRAYSGRTKFGWKPREWAAAVGCSRSYLYLLLVHGELDTVKLGRAASSSRIRAIF
jgi:hypothetical protein